MAGSAIQAGQGSVLLTGCGLGMLRVWAVMCSCAQLWLMLCDLPWVWRVLCVGLCVSWPRQAASAACAGVYLFGLRPVCRHRVW